MTLEFSGTLWFWKGPAPWYFVTVPAQQCRNLKALSLAVTYGWGMISVEVRIGNTAWTTSLWPKDDCYSNPKSLKVRSCSGVRFVLLETAICNIGDEVGSNWRKVGVVTPSGRRGMIALTLSRTFCSAISGTTPSSNSIVICTLPSLEVDVMCVTPLIVVSVFSTGLASWSETVSGSSPG